jgi:uncharacterized cupin superfamily protein
MSQWDNLQMSTKISQILNVQSHDPGHHFGRPFLTPYQIAIRFQKQHPIDVSTIGKPIGGKGTGQQDSLAQYIALELSKRILDGRITNIEGRFLFRENLHTLQYEGDGVIVESSSMQAYDLSMFRLLMPPRNTYPVPFVLITRDFVQRDAEVMGKENKLGRENNNGRKICATEVMTQFDEHTIREPLWKVPAVLPTGDGGLEVATFTEFAGQDRHKHFKGTEIYTVLQGELEIYIDDKGPYVLQAGDEVVILPETVHEIIQKKRRSRDVGETFDLLARVHSLNCYGAADKYVQLEQGGKWQRWSDLSKDERARAYRKQD